MQKAGLIRYGALFAAAFALYCTAAVAGQAAPATPQRMPAHSRGFDWIQHTQRTLEELKGKLNLAPGQMAAWDTWSAGVMKDAHQQLEQKKTWLEESGESEKSPADGTTPDRMARGIERLRAETEWMQEHLKQLEAAQVRTKTFYDALDTNQKTIFDLFWHEVDHRAGGFHGGVGMREGFGPCGPVNAQHECPRGAY